MSCSPPPSGCPIPLCGSNSGPNYKNSPTSSTFNFSIIINGVASPDKDGNVNGGIPQPIPDSLYVIPPYAYIPGMKNITTLAQFMALVGPQNVSLCYYVQATGSIPNHTCWGTWYLNAQGIFQQMVPYSTNTNLACTINTTNNYNLVPVNTSNSSVVAQTSNSPGSGGSIDPVWTPILSNTQYYMTGINTWNTCTSGSGACTICNYGGWDNVSLALRVDVSFQILSYCTNNCTTNECVNPICYNYFQDYLKNNGPQYSSVINCISNYCQTKFPDAPLSIFNTPLTISEEDYNLCGCNMPTSQYNAYQQSLILEDPTLATSFSAPCLFPPCKTSGFKPAGLQGCPGPQCVNAVNLVGNTINKIEISQSNNCANYQINPNAPVTPTSPPNNNIAYIIIFLLVLVFVIILFIYIYFFYKPSDADPTLLEEGIFDQ